MRYPTKLITPTRYRQTLEVFGGLDRRLRIDDGAFRDMENMSADHYPALSTRPGRGLYAKGSAGLIAKDALCYISGSHFVMDGYPIDLGLTPGDKQVVSMGAFVIILPDKKYINTADISDRGDIEAEFIASSDVELTPCLADGRDFDRRTVSPTAPEDPREGDYWLDTAAGALKLYSQGVWEGIATTYLRLSAAGIGAAFAQFDGIALSGCVEENLNGTGIIWAKGEDFIVISGLLENRRVQYADEGSLTVSRKMPQLDFITESENRLWGCRYGLDAQGRVVNELYACALGDFKNWNRFMGLSTDSYAVSCGTDGPFTGAVTYLGYPLFFKQNCIHKVYGSMPEDFRVQTTACRGVQKGSHRSLALVGELLFYASDAGICAYDGSLPVEVGQALGRERWHSAVAGATGSKYYLSVLDDSGASHLLVYDRERRLWHREDGLRAACFCFCRGQLYCLEEGSGDILQLTGCPGAPDRWFVQTGEIGLQLPEQKYVSRMTLRLRLGENAQVRGLARYDSQGSWEQVFFLQSNGLGSFRVPLLPKRCDHMELRLEGVGQMQLYSLTKILEKGSEQP